MRMLALERAVPGVEAARFAPLLEAEARQAWTLHQAGKIRELYFRDDRNDAVLVLECDSVAEAREILATLPLVREKLIDFELVPLRAYSGFARLFVGKT